MSGLFSTFNVAKRGMYVQQKAIDVTAHNIANANTTGYSRQRANIETSRPADMSSVNSIAEPGQLGTGSQISTIQRIRDSFLDYQVRVETSTYGQYDIREKFLTEIETIFNEPSDTGLSTLIGKFFDSWQQLSKQPQSSNARTVVAQQAAALADDLNHTYTQLKKLKENTQEAIKQTVFDVNNMLDQLTQLNQQIISVNISGHTPNDLMDKRDLLIDQLSAKFNINIDKKQFEGVDIIPVDTGNLASPELVKAERNSTGKRLSYISNIEKDLSDASGTTYKLTYYELGDMASEGNKKTITVTGVDADKLKEIEQCRVIWADAEGNAINPSGGLVFDGQSISFENLTLFKPSSGELKGYMSVQKDIDEYMEQLNKLAKALAFSVNAVHSNMEGTSTVIGTDIKYDTTPFFVNKDKASYDSLNNKLNNLEDTLAFEQYITAENISVNKEILYDVMKIKTRTNDNGYTDASENTIDGETDGARALAIATLRDTLMKVQDINVTVMSREDLFIIGGSKLNDKGLGIKNNTSGMKIDNYFKDTIDRLGVQSQEAQRMVKNQKALLDGFEESRQSVSGVSLDEEMANLIQFQHAYQANAKIIATVDELLEVVINGLKR